MCMDTCSRCTYCHNMVISLWVRNLSTDVPKAEPELDVPLPPLVVHALLNVSISSKVHCLFVCLLVLQWRRWTVALKDTIVSVNLPDNYIPLSADQIVCGVGRLITASWLDLSYNHRESLASNWTIYMVYTHYSRKSSSTYWLPGWLTLSTAVRLHTCTVPKCW